MGFDRHQAVGYALILFNGVTDLYGSIALAANTWYDVAYTRSGNDVRVYLNGVLQTIGGKTVNQLAPQYGTNSTIVAGMRPTDHTIFPERWTNWPFTTLRLRAIEFCTLRGGHNANTRTFLPGLAGYRVTWPAGLCVAEAKAEGVDDLGCLIYDLRAHTEKGGRAPAIDVCVRKHKVTGGRECGAQQS